MLPPALALASRAAALLPPAADAGLAAAVGPAWCALDRRRRGAVAANRRALATRFRLSEPFSAYTAALFTWLRLLGADRAWVERRTRFDGLEGADGLRADAARGGVILVAAHVGSWEWGAAALAAAGLPVVAVAGVQMRPAWSPALARAKARLGVEVVDPAADPLRLARALGRGAVVALLVDGDLATARAPAATGAGVAFLPRGPARLAARSGAALWAGRCEPVGSGRHHVRLARLAAPRRPAEDRPLPGAGPGVAAREAVLHARVAAWLEATVRESPGAWCLFRPFFAAPDEPGAPGAAGAA